MNRVVAICFYLLVAILVDFPNQANAAGWPQWLGTDRDSVWAEDGILDRFPDGGPPVRRSVPIAGGYSGPTVADGRVFVMDWIADIDRKRVEPASGGD